MIKLKYKNLYLLIFILAVGVLLRIFRLDNQPIWFDEAGIITEKSKTPFLLWSNQVYYPNPPLYFTLWHYWMACFGYNLFIARLFSAIFGILLIPLIFLFGNRFFSLRVGFLSSLFIAISPFHIYYSQEARMYALLVFLAILSSYIFLVSLEKNKNIYWIGYIIFMTATLYVHNYGIFIFLAHISYHLLFLNRANKKNFFLSTGIILILYTYRLSLFPIQISLHMNPWIIKPTFKSLFRSLQHYTLLSWHIPETLPVKVSLYFLMPFFCFLILKGIFNKSDIELTYKKLFLLWNLFFCTFVPFVASLYIVPLYVPGRYEIIGLPFFILLVSLGISTIKKSLVRCILTIFIVFFTLIVLPTYYFIYQKSNNRYIAEFINKNVKKDDIIIFTNQSALPIYYYISKCEKYFSYPEVTTADYIPKEGLEGDADYVNRQIEILISKINKVITENSYIWLFYNNEPYILNSTLLNMLKQKFNLKENIEFPHNKYTYFEINQCYVFLKLYDK